MIDREKLINGLEMVSNDIVDGYITEPDMACNTINDAISLLKAQGPRVMTLEEVLKNAQKIGFPCWVEDHIEDIGVPFLFPAVVTSDDAYVQYTGNAYYEGAIYHRDYNKRLRCWTSRPDEKRRAETPWE